MYKGMLEVREDVFSSEALTKRILVCPKLRFSFEFKGCYLLLAFPISHFFYGLSERSDDF